MALLIIGGQQVQWPGPGLPLVPFRIGLRAGVAEYRPERVNSGNANNRQQILAMLAAGSLSAGLAELVDRTRAGSNNEFSAYIARGGSLVRITEGDRGSAQVPPPPAGVDVVGYVHTHPVPATVMAPPSGNDYGISFQQFPIQLVVEMGGRVWAAFAQSYCSLLGTLAGRGFQPLSDASTQYVYRTVDGDQLRMEAFLSDEDRARAARQRQEEALRSVAQQREREAAARRAGH